MKSLQIPILLLAGLSVTCCRNRELSPVSPANGQTDKPAAFAIVNVSVADGRADGRYDAEMATQHLLGSTVSVLQKRGEWILVRSSDEYLSLIAENNLTFVDSLRLERWNRAPKVIFTGFFGFACEAPDADSRHVSDLVFGNILRWEGESGNFFKLACPDGREAYVEKSQCRDYVRWLESTEQTLTGENICASALKLTGIPYTWGGTSVKGMDCSGFVKTVYLMHGVVLRRDASQQAETGIPVDTAGNYRNLQPGDLLFFGNAAGNGRRERVQHVAIYIGNRQFIHANGRVRIDSLDPAQPGYDAENTARLLRAARIVGAVGTSGIRRLSNTAATARPAATTP
jgi:hypothetical protein